MPIKTLKSQFEDADAARINVLERSREAAAFTKPGMLPLKGTTDADELVRSYQALGAAGLVNVTNQLLLTIFDTPWFRHKPSAKARNDPTMTQEVAVQTAAGTETTTALAILEKQLYKRDLQIQTQFEATNYRWKYRTAFKHTLGVGNSLTFSGGKDGKYWYKNFRMDQYVQERSSDGEILWTITHEKKDPLKLSDKDIEAIGTTFAELDAKTGDERRLDLYTKCSWQRDGTYKIEQEIKGQILAHRTSIEPVSPYIAIGYDEEGDENYSRGLVEEYMGDLRTFNTHSRSLLDWSTIASKVTPVLDESESAMIPRDLTRPSGEVVIGTVREGEVRGVGFISTKMANDMTVVANIAGTIERRVGKQFLLESEAQRQAERVTATEVMRVARQLEGALGGIYAKLATEAQLPTLKRLIYQMERDKILAPIHESVKAGVDIEILTGLEALSRQKNLEKLLAVLEIIRNAPELLNRLSPERVLTIIFRGVNADMAQVVKTDGEMEAEAEARMAEQVQAATAQQAIQTAGAAVEEGAKQAATAAQPAA